MKTAESTDQRTEKPVVKPAAKVFDVSHPGKSAPSFSARPVIVTNRPIMQDPMMSSPGSDQTLPSKPLGKITLKPLDEAEKAEALSEDKPAAAEQPAVQEPEAAASEESGEVAATEKVVEPEKEAKDTAATTEEKPAVAPEEEKTADSKAQEPADDSPAGTPPEDGKNDETTEEADTAALEAKMKQEEAINGLVESKEFFLPINAVERHRSKIISILGLVLIIVLGLVLLDLLMDVGTLKVPGAHPVTHFFSA